MWKALILIPPRIQQPGHLSQDGSGMHVVKGGSNLYAQVVSGLIKHCPASSITADACVGSVCGVLQLLNPGSIDVVVP